MLTKLFALFFWLAGAGGIVLTLLFGGMQVMPLLLLCIALILTSIWAGIWHIATVLERHNKDVVGELQRSNFYRQRER